MLRVFLNRVLCAVTGVVAVSVSTSHAQNLNAQAQNICGVAVDTFITGKVNAEQFLDQQALQIALRQTSGTGRYQQLQAFGSANALFIDNPHFDNDQSYGQLFHFYCTSQHQTGSLLWELKFAPSINKLVYFTFAPGQAPGSPQQRPHDQQPGISADIQQPRISGDAQQPTFPVGDQQPPRLQNNDTQSRLLSEPVKYISVPDPRHGGIVSSYIPFPTSWKPLSNDKEYIFEGPNSTRVSGAFSFGFQFSNNNDGLQMLQLQGLKNTPPYALKQIIDEFFMPLAREKNRELIRTYPLPDLAQRSADLDARLFKAVPVQQSYDGYALEWKDNQGLSYVTAITVTVSQAFPISNWSVLGQYMVARHADFEQARDAFLYALIHTETNPEWLHRVNAIEAKRANIRWQDHRSRMSVIESRGASSRSVAKIYGEISDITHAGYLNRSAIQSAGQKNLVRAIGGSSVIINQDSGERYQVDGNHKYNWVNNNGVHVGTENALFDPRTDEQLKMFDWSQFRNE